MDNPDQIPGATQFLQNQTQAAPVQTGILGMHKIQERPMAIKGEVKVLPMMYLALSYDHRMIDGKEAVQFLVTVKDFLEDPSRIILEI